VAFNSWCSLLLYSTRRADRFSWERAAGAKSSLDKGLMSDGKRDACWKMARGRKLPDVFLVITGTLF